MKVLATTGWVLLLLEVLIVVVLFMTKNAGNDAAGRGVATGFAMVITPFLLAAGALLWWSAHGGPRAAFFAGLGIVVLPFVIGLALWGNNLIDRLNERRNSSIVGTFQDPALTALAKVIEQKDTERLRGLLSRGTIDWSARDDHERTILGNALELVAADYLTTDYVGSVRMLLDAGAPVRDDVLWVPKADTTVPRPGVVTLLYQRPHAGAREALELLLQRGLSPEAADYDRRPLHFSSDTRVDALEMLARHGATFAALDTREDRRGWNALMGAVAIGLWPAATYFLEHGISPDYTAPDGKTARSILQERDAAGQAYYGDDAPSHAAFVSALAAHDRKK